jgi:hypothetical protein
MARLMVPRDQGARLSEAGCDDLERRSVHVVWDLLLEPGELDTGLANHLSSVGQHATIQEAHERAFSSAIATEQADALATLDRQIGAIEHRGPSERDADLADTYHSHLITPVRTR